MFFARLHGYSGRKLTPDKKFVTFGEVLPEGAEAAGPQGKRADTAADDRRGVPGVLRREPLS